MPLEWDVLGALLQLQHTPLMCSKDCCDCSRHCHAQQMALNSRAWRSPDTPQVEGHVGARPGCRDKPARLGLMLSSVPAVPQVQASVWKKAPQVPRMHVVVGMAFKQEETYSSSKCTVHVCRQRGHAGRRSEAVCRPRASFQNVQFTILQFLVKCFCDCTTTSYDDYGGSHRPLKYWSLCLRAYVPGKRPYSLQLFVDLNCKDATQLGQLALPQQYNMDQQGMGRGRFATKAQKNSVLVYETP